MVIIIAEHEMYIKYLNLFLYFLVAPQKFNLADCTEDEKANTTICLLVKHDVFNCDEDKLSYDFQCGKMIAFIRALCCKNLF